MLNRFITIEQHENRDKQSSMDYGDFGENVIAIVKLSQIMC